MSDETEQQAELPGLSDTEFTAAVKVLAELRDRGKYLFFLSRGQHLRLIGNLPDFSARYAEELGGESVNEKRARSALTEVRNFLSATLAFESASETALALEQSVFAASFRNRSEDARSELREALTRKSELVAEALLTGQIKYRDSRLGSAVGPCLEDLDVEVVSERHDRLSEATVTTPFLRLRLRYTEGPSIGLPAGPPPATRIGIIVTKTLELECDETDIDLLLDRLVLAKKLLSNTSAQGSSWGE